MAKRKQRKRKKQYTLENILASISIFFLVFGALIKNTNETLYMISAYLFIVFAIIAVLFDIKRKLRIKKSNNMLHKQPSYKEKREFEIIGDNLSEDSSTSVACSNSQNEELNQISQIKNIKVTKAETISENTIKAFNDLVKKANTQTSNEILEVLSDFEELDIKFSIIKELSNNFMSDLSYIELKKEILNNIINDKFRKTSNIKKKKKERLLSLYDELNACKSRSNEYDDIFDKYIELINKSINKI